MEHLFRTPLWEVIIHGFKWLAQLGANHVEQWVHLARDLMSF